MSFPLLVVVVVVVLFVDGGGEDGDDGIFNSAKAFSWADCSSTKSISDHYNTDNDTKKDNLKPAIRRNSPRGPTVAQNGS